LFVYLKIFYFFFPFFISLFFSSRIFLFLLHLFSTILRQPLRIIIFLFFVLLVLFCFIFYLFIFFVFN